MGIHTLIKNEYEKRSLTAAEMAEKRKQEVYKAIPRIEEIDAEVAMSGIRYGKALLQGGAMDSAAAVINGNGIMAASTGAIGISEKLAQELSRLKREKAELLSAGGYPADYLEPRYICGICRDTGYIEGGAGSTRCGCYNQMLVELLYEHSNLKLTETENFSSFNAGYYPDTADEARYGIRKSPRENILGIKDKCLKFVERFDIPEEKNLYFTGPTGIGKTFMANCIAREILDRSRTVLYQTAPSLFDVITSHKMRTPDKYEDTDDMYESIFKVNLLIIDDLGTESRTASRWAELLNILNTRYVNNLSFPCKTIISTNAEHEELFDYYSERIESRIIGSFSIYRFAGEDIRKLKRL